MDSAIKHIIPADENNLNIVIVGHVDHGKSTVIGRLLADTGSLPDGKLEAVREMCRRTSKPFEYAFLLDALKDERSQGITIDTARSFFKTEKRRYIIIDAPGHIEFLKNMITGASRAEAALLVIDAAEGIMENSRRHGYMLSMLGIKQVAVLVNKMDLVNYDRGVFDGIAAEYGEFLKKLGMTPKCFIPVSAMNGDNIATRSEAMPWFESGTVLSVLDEFEDTPTSETKPLRLPVQDIYKFTGMGDDRRIVAGTVEAGRIRAGDEIIFFPSGKKTRVKTLEVFNRNPADSFGPGESAGFTISEQIYVKRGEIAARKDEHEPEVSTRIKANIFWLGKKPFESGKRYFLKINSCKADMELEEILSVLDASTLGSTKKDRVERHEVAECILKTTRPIAFDLADEIAETSRFVIVDNYEITGGGIITASLEDEMTDYRQRVLLRNYKWENSGITPERRAKKYSQKAALIVISGNNANIRKNLAKALETALFEEGRYVYYLGMGNMIYGMDSDIYSTGNRPRAEVEEHIRRVAELANIMLDSGTILILTAADLGERELELIATGLSGQAMLKVTADDAMVSATSIISMLENRGIIFKV